MDPFSISLALALMLGGTYFKNKGMENVLNAQHGYSATERARQGGLEQDKQAAITGALPQLSRPAQEEQHGDIAGRIAQYLTPQAGAPGDYTAMNPASPQEVQDRRQAAMDEAAGKGRDYASKLADVSAYNLLNFNNNVTLGRTGEKVGNIAGAQLHSSEILPFELQDAQRAGMHDMVLSDLMNGAGSIAGMYAATGGRAPAVQPAGMGGGTGITPGATAPTLRVSPGEYGSPNLFSPNGGGQGLRVAGAPRIAF